MLPLWYFPTNSLTPQEAYLFSKKSWEEKTLKTNFFHLYRTFLTTVLNQFQTSESVFQNVAHVRKYSFQMEVRSDLVTLNLFADAGENTLHRFPPRANARLCRARGIPPRDWHAPRGLCELAGLAALGLWACLCVRSRYTKKGGFCN